MNRAETQPIDSVAHTRRQSLGAHDDMGVMQAGDRLIPSLSDSPAAQKKSVLSLRSSALTLPKVGRG